MSEYREMVMALERIRLRKLLIKFREKAKAAKEDGQFAFGNGAMAFYEGKAEAWTQAADELETLLR